MENKITYTIKPQDVLDQQNIKYKRKGMWLSVKYCPFCQGGDSGQQWTFGIRIDDYNYNCLRTTCGQASNFWNLLKHFGYKPQDHIEKTYQKTSQSSKRYKYKPKNRRI